MHARNHSKIHSKVGRAVHTPGFTCGRLLSFVVVNVIGRHALRVQTAHVQRAYSILVKLAFDFMTVVVSVALCSKIVYR